MGSKWESVRLGDTFIEIIDGDRGKNYPSRQDFTENGYCLFLNTKNVPNTKFDFSSCFFISKEKDMLLRKGKLDFEDIVMTTRGTVGNFAHYKDSCMYPHVRINSGMVIFRNKDKKIDTNFLNCLFSSSNLQGQIKELTSGSAQPQLPIKDIKKLEISLPPLEEQKRIAAILSAFDDKITLNQEMNKTLEAMAQALFKSWFVDFEPFGGVMPSDWREIEFGSIATIQNGYAFKSSDYCSSGCDMIRTTNFDNGYVSSSSLIQLPEDFYYSAKYKNFILNNLIHCL